MDGKWRNRRGPAASVVLLGSLGLLGLVLGAWKALSIGEANTAAAKQPEPMTAVTLAVARAYDYRGSTTSIGTVLALRSVTLRNELAGTVRQAALEPGRVVEPGALLVALDVSVEEADLRAQAAQAALAQTTLTRLQGLRQSEAVSEEEVDQAKAQLDVTQAQMARTRAIIARKTIRAPFRARVGLSDVHEGQYLNEGTVMTTLQGVGEAVDVDFAVSQQVAEQLRAGGSVQVVGDDSTSIAAQIVALDARVDPTTRNAMVRARIADGAHAPPPGASVRVVVAVGPQTSAVVVPASALRNDPSGDRVFVVAADGQGQLRAHVRPVQAGPLVGDDVVILAGLQPGDKLAASGSFKLREGALVAAEDATPAGKEAR
jgi:membrane fusion protein (multidrug efflux system)